MTIESPDLSGELTLLQRDEIERKYKRDYGNRIPDADLAPGGQPDIDAKTFADQQMVLMNDARVISEATIVRDARGERLNRIGASESVERPAAEGSRGFVAIVASTGGVNIDEGLEIADPATSLLFECAATKLYADGDSVPVRALDTGPATNLAAGTVLEWVSPPAGLAKKATVVEQSDGTGLTGGREAATDEEYIAVIEDARANPPAAGNDAEVRKHVRKTPALAVEDAWTFPAIEGPGTTCFVFTLKPQTLGGSRIPNTAQIAAAEASAIAGLPYDDGVFAAQLIAEDVEVALGVLWRRGAAAWADREPWPPFIDGNPVRVSAQAPQSPLVLSPTCFRVYTNGSAEAPQIGQSIAVYDLAKGRFRNKRILEVDEITPGQKWDLVFDTANDASDVSFTPPAETLVCPWSTSLQGLVSPVLQSMGTLGPGEMVDPFPDPGRRQRRQPESPGAWPSIITNKAFFTTILPSVADAEVLLPTTIPYPTSVGTAGVFAYLLTLSGLGIYPE